MYRRYKTRKKEINSIFTDQSVTCPLPLSSFIDLKTKRRKAGSLQAQIRLPMDGRGASFRSSPSGSSCQEQGPGNSPSSLGRGRGRRRRRWNRRRWRRGLRMRYLQRSSNSLTSFSYSSSCVHSRGCHVTPPSPSHELQLPCIQ